MSDTRLHEFDDSRSSVIASAVSGHARHATKNERVAVGYHRYGRVDWTGK